MKQPSCTLRVFQPGQAPDRRVESVCVKSSPRRDDLVNPSAQMRTSEVDLLMTKAVISFPLPGSEHLPMSAARVG